MFRTGDEMKNQLSRLALPASRDDQSREAASPAPPGSADWLEMCRKQFIRQWHEQHPDDFEFCNEAYGDHK
jgi:hypothetical protein